MLIREQFGIAPKKQMPGRDIGIEVEMEGQPLPMDPPIGWRMEADGSLRGQSCEFVLNKPVPRAEKKKYLTNLAKCLIEAGTKQVDSDRCGVHIHVNIQELTTSQAMNFVTLYLIFEDLMVHYCGDEREGNLFCLRACDADMMLQMLRICHLRESLNEMANDHFRYASVNIAAVAKYGSLEFRALKTPKNVMDIEEWIDLILAIKDHSMAFETPKQMVESFSKIGAEKFLKNCFGDLGRLITCKGYEKMILEGVRRVQDVAYAKVKAGAAKPKAPFERDEELDEAPRPRVRPGPAVRNAWGDPIDINGQVVHEPIRAARPARAPDQINMGNGAKLRRLNGRWVKVDADGDPIPNLARNREEAALEDLLIDQAIEEHENEDLEEIDLPPIGEEGADDF